MSQETSTAGDQPATTAPAGTLYQPTPSTAPRPIAAAGTATTPAASTTQPSLNTIQANLSSLLRTPASATHSAQIAAALAPHMTQIMNLAKQGTLTESQMAQLKTLAGIVAPGGQQATAAANAARPAAANAPPRPAGTPQPAAATTSAQTTAPKPAGTTTQYPAAQQSWTRPVPVLANQILPQYTPTSYPSQSTAIPGPAPTPRRVLRELVYGFEPDVKVDADAEQFLLQAADDFIDSITQFACRVAKHRGSDTLEVKDLQLHLERNYDLHIPGFATDDTRHATATAAQASIASAVSKPIAPLPATRKSRHRATDPAALRASRLAAVRDAASRPA